MIQAFTVRRVEGSLSQDAEYCLGTEIIFVVKAVHRFEDFFGGQSGILNVSELVAALIHHFVVADHEAVFHRIVVEFGSGISVGHGYLNSLDVKLFGKSDRGVNGFVSFTREAEDEVAVNHQAQLVTILSELAGALDSRAFLDVLEDLLVARLVADDQQTATRFLHGLQSFIVGRDSGSARPSKLQRLQLGAQFDGSNLLDVEGIVVEEKLSHIWPEFFGLGHLTSYVVRGAFAPRVTAQSLRPEAKRALCGATTGGVERNVRVKQEWDVVFRHVQITAIDLGHMGQGIEILNLRAVGSMNDRSIVSVRDPQDFFQRLAICELAGRVVELLAHHEIDLRTIFQRPLGQHSDMRSDERNLDLGIRLANLLYQSNITGKAWSAGKQHQELIIAGDVDSLFCGHVMRRGIEQTRTLQHSGRVGEPDRVPIAFNFASSRPTRAGSSVKILEGRGIQKQGF